MELGLAEIEKFRTHRNFIEIEQGCIYVSFCPGGGGYKLLKGLLERKLKNNKEKGKGMGGGKGGRKNRTKREGFFFYLLLILAQTGN